MGHPISATECDGEISEYTLKKEMLMEMPFVMYWSVQDINPDDYIGKRMKKFKFIIKNHVLDNAANNTQKSTIAYIIICDNKLIGGYSVPDYSEPLIGEWVYSIDGKTLEEKAGTSYSNWLTSWEKKYK